MPTQRVPRTPLQSSSRRSPRKWTDADEEVLKRLYAQGRSAHSIAQELGRSKGTISHYSKLLGLSWDRERSAAASSANHLDAKSRRALLRLNLLADVERLRQQVWQPAIVYNFGGKDNTYEERTLDRPPVQDQLKLMQSVSTGVSTIERLEKMDADEGIEAVVGMLDNIAAAITKAAEDLIAEGKALL